MSTQNVHPSVNPKCDEHNPKGATVIELPEHVEFEMPIPPRKGKPIGNHRRWILNAKAGQVKIMTPRDAHAFLQTMYRIKPRPQYTRRELDDGSVGIWMLTDGAPPIGNSENQAPAVE